MIVKLNITEPVNLELSGPAHLYYQGENGWIPVLEGALPPGKTWFCGMEKGKILLTTGAGDSVTSFFPLLFVPVETDKPVKINGQPYPGKIELRPGFTVGFFNHTGLEDYVAGVLAGETYPHWPPAALQAIAVAVRTYTLFNLNRHGEFDFCDQVHCQKYAGLPQAPAFLSAVAATRGQVLTWEGRLINAVYHASSGGFTQNNEDVWEGEALPYLRGVEDFDQNGEKYYWAESFIFTGEELAAKLGLNGNGPLEIFPVTAGERGFTGLGFRREKGNGEMVIRYETVRRLLRLPGPNFRFYKVNMDELAAAASRLEELVLGKGIEFDREVSLEARIRLLLPVEEIHGRTLIGPGEGVLVIGRGAGHGVGLSQWGARALAEKGCDYRRILNHYYGEKVIIQRAY
ncbi:MAG: SpoIID/LytB domain-containing protein [Clostridia bacterium]|nr:SpoIID/LytB domain-containing protein [Clostridia bacterium]